MTVVTPTDRPKSARNRCVMEVWWRLYDVSLISFSDGMETFIGLGQIVSFSPDIESRDASV